MPKAKDIPACPVIPDCALHDRMIRQLRGECRVFVVPRPSGGNSKDEQWHFRPDGDRWLLDCGDVRVNWADLTSLSGMAVQNLMDRGRDLNRACIHFVLIDCRPPEQQRCVPYIKGETRRLDKLEGGGHADN